MTDDRLDVDERLEPDEEMRLAEALRAAYEPAELDPALNELFIEQALEDPLAPATDDEVAASERLRDALEAGTPHADADLARALAAAVRASETALDARRAEALSARAVDRKRGNVIYVAFGVVAGAVALAASVALVLSSDGRAPAAEPVLAVSRSTAPLFTEPFETASTSARVDRIAAARERDLRNNRYALWGVSR
jgi:hypothetical protein